MEASYFTGDVNAMMAEVAQLNKQRARARRWMVYMDSLSESFALGVEGEKLIHHKRASGGEGKGPSLSLFYCLQRKFEIFASYSVRNK